MFGSSARTHQGPLLFASATAAVTAAWCALPAQAMQYRE
jgi:hypothetical protein